MIQSFTATRYAWGLDTKCSAIDWRRKTVCLRTHTITGDKLDSPICRAIGLGIWVALNSNVATGRRQTCPIQYALYLSFAIQCAAQTLKWKTSYRILRCIRLNNRKDKTGSHFFDALFYISIRMQFIGLSNLICFVFQMAVGLAFKRPALVM